MTISILSTCALTGSHSGHKNGTMTGTLCILRGNVPSVQAENETDVVILTAHAIVMQMIHYHSVSQPFFHGGTPNTFFHILMKIYRPEKVDSLEPFCCHQLG
jgi:hypothetical protein